MDDSAHIGATQVAAGLAKAQRKASDWSPLFKSRAEEENDLAVLSLTLEASNQKAIHKLLSNGPAL